MITHNSMLTKHAFTVEFWRDIIIVCGDESHTFAKDAGVITEKRSKSKSAYSHDCVPSMLYCS